MSSSLEDVIVIIPARAGSKGIPGKNIRKLNGKPLLSYSVEAAQKVFRNNQILLSTDSAEMLEIGNSYGIIADQLRPKALAGDKTPMRDVLLHEIKRQEKSFLSRLLLLQPTCPFRDKTDLENLIGLWDENIDMVVSVYDSDSNPYYNLFEENQSGFLEKSKPGNYTDRQSCPKVYKYNGNMYLININSLEKQHMSEFSRIKKYEMSKEKSIDMDKQIDWKFAEFMLEEKLVTL